MSDHPNFIKDPVNYNKKGKKRTGVGKFLANLKNTGRNIAEPLLDAVGVGDMARAFGIISEDPENAGLTNDEVRELMTLHEMDMKDRADARSMYKVESTTANKIAMRVINYNIWVVMLAVLIEVLVVIYIEDKTLIAVISTAIGMVTGALIQERQQVISFFFGSSLGSKQKSEQLKS